MTRNVTLEGLGLLLILTLSAAACDKSAATADAGADTASDACTHDNCVVPLADIEGVCGPTLHDATMDCPGVTVSTGPCGTLTHVALKTINPVQDCYYDTASGALVGGIVRSDDGFTKIAGTIPTETCPATTQVCDHTTT